MGYKINKIYIGEDLVWPRQMPAGIYHNSSLGLISLSPDGTNWTTIADKNYGATTVYNSGNTVSAANAGNFFQWGNNYPFPYTGATNIVNTYTDASTYGPGNYYSSSTFRNIQGYPLHWDSSLNENLWGDTTNTLAARQGPCDTGWHVPTISEWFALLDDGATLGAWNARASCGTNLMTYLKLPIVYLHNGATPYTFNGGFICSSFGNYQSTQDGDQLMITTSGMANVMNMATVGACLRPFKNVPVTPNNSWTKLYPTT